MKHNTKYFAHLGVLSALSIIISTVETLMPPIFPLLPYARLGLANCIVLFAVISIGSKEGLFILLTKSFFSAIFSGNPTSVLYSLSGGLASLGIMLLLIILKKNSVTAISCMGGVLHNIGQLIVASLITLSVAPLALTPYMIFLGGISGSVTGLLCHVIIKRLFSNGGIKDFNKNL